MTEPAATGQRSDIPESVWDAAVEALGPPRDLSAWDAASAVERVVRAVAPLLVQASREAAARDVHEHGVKPMEAAVEAAAGTILAGAAKVRLGAYQRAERLARGTHQEGASDE